MNAPVQTIAPRKIAHKTENFSVDLTEGKTQAAVLAEIKEANFTLGSKSLAQLMKGEKTEAGDFTIVGGMEIIDAAPKEVAKTDNKPTKEERDALKAQQKKDQEARAQAAKDAKAAKDVKDANADKKTAETAIEVKTIETEDAAAIAAQKLKDAEEAKANLAAAQKQLDDAKLALKEAQKAAKVPVTKAAGEPKAPRQLIDWSAELPAPGVYMPLRKGTVMDSYFQMLCDPKGTTKQQFMDKFGWSAGGLSGILGWEPKKKGYLLVSEKVDGVLHYHLQFHAQDEKRAGQRVQVSDLTYVQPKPAPEPKAPKAPKETAAPKAGDAPAQPSGGVKHRVSAKKQAELDKAAAAAAGAPA